MVKDNTEYYLLTSDYVSVADFDVETILKVEPEALTLLAQQAFHDSSFILRPAHQKQVAAILHDPEASENDNYVALQLLRKTAIAAHGGLPTCHCRLRRRNHPESGTRSPDPAGAASLSRCFFHAPPGTQETGCGYS